MPKIRTVFMHTPLTMEGRADAALQALGDGDDFDRVVDLANPWVAVSTTAVDGTLAELAEAFHVPTCAVGASVAGLIDGGHVVEVRGRHLRPIEWVPPQDGAGIVLCDV